MWTVNKNFPQRGLSTPPPTWNSKCLSPAKPASERKRTSSPQAKADHLFHVIHKVPAGDSPYVRAKHVQLIDKDPSRAISLFWAAINSGDRVDSALKDMAVVMKQLNRSEEAIEAIKSFRHLCLPESQESLDNVLVELYKRSGKVEEQIEVLQVKLKEIEEGLSFGGKRTKMARSQGKKIQITIEQEYSRLLGNLAWAHLQRNNYKLAEEHYRKALCFEPDKNKQCNLAICLMQMNRKKEAKFLLQTIQASSENGQMDESYAKSFERAIQILNDLESTLDVQPDAHEENEICTPSSQVHYRSLKELAATPTNGGQNPVSSVVGLPDRLLDEHSEETVLSDKWNRGFRVRNHHDSRTYSFGFDKRNSKGTPFCLRNDGSHLSQQTLLDDKLKNGSYMESPYERRSDFCGKRNDSWNSSKKPEYAIPIPAGEIRKVPFTQPRRCSWSFSNGDQRRALAVEDTAGGCNRKLSFEKPIIAENAQFLSNSGDWRKRSWGNQAEVDTGQDWRKRSRGNQAEVNNGSILGPLVDGDWKWKFQDYDSGQKNMVTSKNNLTMESSSYGHCDQKSSNDTAVDNVRFFEMVEPLAEDQNPTHELLSKSKSHSKSMKCWADMVEEDEQDFLNCRIPTPRKCSGGAWNTGEEFHDENTNSNIIHETPGLLNQIDNLSQKIESFDLKDGYYTQPHNDASSVNRAVRRSLCFNPLEKPNKAECYGLSPLQKKALNFEVGNSVLTNESECTSGNGIKLMRRNRLQVFQDITQLSESPRASSELCTAQK